MNKEFYDKYSKDLECSSCITLTRCMNEDRPLCTRGYIKFQEDTAITMQKQIIEKEKLIEEQKIRIRALNEENFLLKDDIQAAVKIQNKHDTEKANLEAKLAESEKERQMWQEMYKNADRQNKTICETDIYPLQEQVQQLKQQLSEKEKEETKRMEDFEKGCQEYYSTDEYKRDFAIAELEQLKHNILTNQHDDGWLDEQVDIYELTEMIDQQIKELKECN